MLGCQGRGNRMLWNLVLDACRPYGWMLEGRGRRRRHGLSWKGSLCGGVPGLLRRIGILSGRCWILACRWRMAMRRLRCRIAIWLRLMRGLLRSPCLGIGRRLLRLRWIRLPVGVVTLCRRCRLSLRVGLRVGRGIALSGTVLARLSISGLGMGLRGLLMARLRVWMARMNARWVAGWPIRSRHVVHPTFQSGLSVCPDVPCRTGLTSSPSPPEAHANRRPDVPSAHFPQPALIETESSRPT